MTGTGSERVFGEPLAGVSCVERPAAYICVFDTEGQVAAVLADGIGEHELAWVPLSEAETAFRHACHTWAIHLAHSGTTRL